MLACSLYGALAQLVEQLTLNQLVVGSIPTRPTISKNGLWKTLQTRFSLIHCRVIAGTHKQELNRKTGWNPAWILAVRLTCPMS